MRRRQFLEIMVGSAFVPAGKLLIGAESTSKPYVRANTDWLAKCRYGMSVHWTAGIAPRKGPPVSFQEAVNGFEVKKFVDQVGEAGADYLLFTSTHGRQMLPAPHPIIDRILPGRTCKRDLIAELADALAKKGILFLLYYNHSCNHKDDGPWEQAVGYHDADKEQFARNLCEIISWIGHRYQEKVKAWWFDSSYSLDPRGPENSVTTDLRGFQFPWERLTEAAKTGYPARLVTYNAGVGRTFLYTTHQDYWAGEMNDLNHPPTARYLASGLQWFGWTCLDEPSWGHGKLNAEIAPPLYSDETVATFVRACNAHQAPMTFNLGVYQEGSMAPASVEQLHRLGTALGKKNR